MKRTRFISIMLLVLGLSLHSLVQADESSLLYVEITEIQQNTYKLQLKIPSTNSVSNTPIVALPKNCVETKNHRIQNREQSRSNGSIRQKLYYCQDKLTGKTVTINYPVYNPSIASLIKFTAQTGEMHTAILDPEKTKWRIPAAETKLHIAKEYTRLGIYHIWAGLDHLLFLVCLLWIAGNLRRILITVTGFTLTHSVTLALSALDIVYIPVPPVEAVISLSVVFLATEIAKGPRNSMTWRYPIVVSSSFGFLHGLGFAAVLNDIGLPQTELVTGLLFFNLGVEIGQGLFVVAIASLLIFVNRACSLWIIKTNIRTYFRTVSSYTIGVISSYWLVERCMSY